MKMSGADPDAEFLAAVAGDNASFAGLARDGVTIAVHICRGNSRSRWYTEGGYDAIAEKLFSRLEVDRFLLEYDTDRSGTFEPLRLVPRGKDVVLGLITTKEPTLEREEDLRRRIDQAARYMPLDNLAISPQCGFASIAAGNLLSEDDQWKKLELVVSVARRRGGRRRCYSGLGDGSSRKTWRAVIQPSSTSAHLYPSPQTEIELCRVSAIRSVATRRPYRQSAEETPPSLSGERRSTAGHDSPSPRTCARRPSAR